MHDPDPAVILDCGHVEHPQTSGCCQTTDCPNYEPTRPTLMEWGSVLFAGLLLWWVQHTTGEGMVDILLDSLPALFTS